ncbi:MAG: dodecin family protein [Caldilineales bacterium]
MAVEKIIELVGNSQESWGDAARNALFGAAKSLHGITEMEVVRWTAKVAGNEIIEYRAAIRVAFVVD